MLRKLGSGHPEGASLLIQLEALAEARRQFNGAGGGCNLDARSGGRNSVAEPAGRRVRRGQRVEGGDIAAAGQGCRAFAECNRSGWVAKVVEEGVVRPGDSIEILRGLGVSPALFERT